MATNENTQRHEGWVLPPELRLQLLAALSRDPEQRQTITYEDFLEWADEDTLAEWVDGTVVTTSPASLRHQMLVSYLVRVLSDYAELFDAGVVIAAPYQMKLARSGREPDVLFVAREHRDRLQKNYLDGPADLVIEVVSPESAARDRGEKFYEYEAGGVPEYWLLDPVAERAEVYQLDGDGAYRLAAPDAEGACHSRALPGFWLKTEWLWRDPLPSVTATLRAVAGEAYMREQSRRLSVDQDGML